LKDRSEDEVVLEEYVDGIHFITSFCVHFGVQPIFTLKDNIPKLEKNAITIKFNKLFKTLCKFDISNKYKDNVKLIKKFYKKFLILGYGLGFNTEQILKAYDKKNTINHKRQENKY
jgi:dimeric dUTPase (all-alpha-NTP-PPase superfamily)